MEAVVRSRAMAATGKEMEKTGIGDTARTMAGVRPTDLLYLAHWLGTSDSAPCSEAVGTFEAASVM